MTIVGGFDVHRAQITFDYLVTETGEVRTGQVAPANRLVLRRWLRQFQGEDDVAFAVEGCTGWRFVAEELRRAGHVVHVAEPADTRTLRGSKKRAKTDRADARHLRQLLAEGRLPESWVPPVQVLEVRAKARLYVSLMDERRAWQQRIHAQLFHQGVPAPGRNLLSPEGRERLAKARLSPAGRQIVDVGLSAIDHLTGLVLPLKDEIKGFAPRQPGCRALMGIYGIGALTAPIVWAELGDTRRFTSSEKAVRSPAWTSRSGRPTGNAAARVISLARARRRCAGPSSKRPTWLLGRRLLTTPTTSRSVTVSAPTAPPCRSLGSWSAVPITSCATSVTRPGRRPPDMAPVRAPARDQLMFCGPLPYGSCRHLRVDGLERSGGRSSLTGSTRYAITSPDGSLRPSTEIRPGARAHPGTRRPKHRRTQPMT